MDAYTYTNGPVKNQSKDRPTNFKSSLHEICETAHWICNKIRLNFRSSNVALDVGFDLAIEHDEHWKINEFGPKDTCIINYKINYDWYIAHIFDIKFPFYIKLTMIDI